MKHIWIILPLLLLSLTLTACSGRAAKKNPGAATTTSTFNTQNKQAQAAIKSVVFSRAAGSVPADQWRKKELHIKNDLSVALIDYNIRGQIVSQKRARVKQQQYQNLVRSLNQANYGQLRSKIRNKQRADGVTDLVTISSNAGIIQFKQDNKLQFPPAIQKIFTDYTNAR